MNYNIKGYTYPVKFNFNTIRKFCKNNGIASLNQFDTIVAEFVSDNNVSLQNIELIMSLVLEGFREGARLEGSKCDITLDDLFAEMSETPDFIGQMMAMFNETQPPSTSSGDDDDNRRLSGAEAVEAKKKV